ncbi:head closure Hc1 [Arthrobacter phage MargaretKali]|uniref:Head-to-tail connector protein n=1 Tax=Arthrobacter phage MargaretKali TaxID=2250414 RepID=A0A345KMZ1_9CAUD|nr:head closure Hc1 [Arthrobacter phage MargaretKali]AXH44393.1 hypothetical protein SEA_MARGARETKALI_11 [Arthrobacter phage MargaretKali]
MAEVEISYEFIQKAAQQPGVAAALQAVANRVHARAQQMADKDGVDMRVTTQAGVRPGGRPFVNVVGDNADQEFGTSRMGRFRILGRAGAGG